jgi:hypothetical protein
MLAICIQSSVYVRGKNSVAMLLGYISVFTVRRAYILCPIIQIHSSSDSLCRNSEINIRGGGKPFTSSSNIRQGRGGGGGGDTASPPPLPPLFPSGSVDISYKDDATVILNLGVSCVDFGIKPESRIHERTISLRFLGIIL